MFNPKGKVVFIRRFWDCLFQVSVDGFDLIDSPLKLQSCCNCYAVLSECILFHSLSKSVGFDFFDPERRYELGTAAFQDPPYRFDRFTMVHGCSQNAECRICFGVGCAMINQNFGNKKSDFHLVQTDAPNHFPSEISDLSDYLISQRIMEFHGISGFLV